tara:strand:+ start:2777 stop:3112 length:336 start_codon:yes stop_codon:yes gene_type:complete
MKVVRKKRKGVKIEHNWKILLAIILLLIIFIFVVKIIIDDGKEIVDVVKDDLCVVDEDCVPASCCHSESCIIKEKAPDCNDIFCSQVCSGPLDCGAGSCGCVNNKCEVVPN